MNPRPDLLDALMSQVLANMSVISETASRSYDGNLVHGGERDHTPSPLVEKPLVDYWRQRYSNAYSQRSRREVLFAAIDGLKAARAMRIPEGQPPTIDSPLWKQWVADSPMPHAEIARLFNVSRQYVHRIRENYSVRRSVI